MKETSLAVSRRTFYRLALIAAFVFAGIGVSPIGSSASGGGVVDGGNLYIGATAVVNSGPLNLRSGAGTGYSVIEVLSEGTYVEVLDGPYSANGYKWWEVYVDGTKSVGFVAGVYLTVVSSGPFAIGDTVYVTSDSLNVRSGPGTGYSVIDVITYGTNGLIIDGPVSANGYVWYQIEYVGGTYNGWVASDFLGLVSGTGIYIGATVYVTSDSLNVRSGPGTGYAIESTLSYGTEGYVIDGPVTANGYTWWQIEYLGGYVGWAAGEYLALA
jgi:uncharacterized protein YgiM (DUF1202 family)